MKNYNFFIDIDGTLIGAGVPHITEGVKETIKKARKLGAKFFINTARPRVSIHKDLSDPEIFDGLCTGGGTYIEFGGKCVYNRYMTKEELNAIASAYTRLSENFILIYEAKEHLYIYGEKTPRNESIAVYLDSPEAILDIPEPKVQKFCSFSKSDRQASKEFLSEMSKTFDVFDHGKYMEAMSPGYTKGGAIKLAERELSIPHETTVAIGDSINDVSMFEYAALSVAMGNAPDKIKALCTITTTDYTEDGVARAIEKIMEI